MIKVGREPIVTLEEAKDWVRIDDVLDEEMQARTDRQLERLIAQAEQYLYDATGRWWSSDNETAWLLVLTIVADNYDNRTITSKEKLSIRPTIRSMINQLLYTPLEKDGDV